MEEYREEQKAEVEIWKYVFAFADVALMKCAIELGIPDIIASNGEPMTLSQLSHAIGAACNSSALLRVMRFLVHKGVFGKQACDDGIPRYSLTPISRLLTKHGEKSMANFVEFENHPVMVGTWHGLSAVVRGGEIDPFTAANGQDLWEYAARYPEYSELLNRAMSCIARCTVPVVVESCMEVFRGLSTVVDVGGGNGTAMRALVKACPWIRGISFDLPHVIAGATAHEGIEHVGGDMFVSIPKADAAFLMWVLHDLGDEECIKILGKCREAIPTGGGKVIIVDVVIKEDEQHDLKDVRFTLDMAMLAHTNTGKERTEEEWKNIIIKAGFSRYTIKPIRAIQSVIVAYT